MAIVRCEKGHIYNSDQYTSCPSCSSEGYRIDFGRQDRTEAVNPAEPQVIGNVGKTVGIDGLPGANIPAGLNPEDIGKTMAAGFGNRAVSKDAPRPVTGWLVCVKGPNAGRSFELHSDYNYVGSERGDVTIPGDAKISREKHMIITYDAVERSFFISPDSGANIIRCNGKALFGGVELNAYDLVETGDSGFMFVPFCCGKFDWSELENKENKA